MKLKPTFSDKTKIETAPGTPQMFINLVMASLTKLFTFSSPSSSRHLRCRFGKVRITSILIYNKAVSTGYANTIYWRRKSIVMKDKTVFKGFHRLLP